MMRIARTLSTCCDTTETARKGRHPDLEDSVIAAGARLSTPFDPWHELKKYGHTSPVV